MPYTYRFAEIPDVNGRPTLSRETNPPVPSVYQRACALTFASAKGIFVARDRTHFDRQQAWLAQQDAAGDPARTA
ncbi:hypothetical protein [Frankia sp. Cas3]|uniref:hypothetical protein n=1 Tax=Frankia sp. Cas3 TaxID=3073926 RepID=UPI002AD41179|nr:hypothetical protein [Frankia sp. Cas3]